MSMLMAALTKESCAKSATSLRSRDSHRFAPKSMREVTKVVTANHAIVCDAGDSCRNRHCPKCQSNARDKWLRARQPELLPAIYYHLVFSVPHRLVPLIWQNQRLLFTLLFEASAATLLEVAADPRHLGAHIGFLSV